MKLYKFTFLILTLLFLSCSKDPKVMLDHLNGYWEIQEVTLKTGIKKEYRFNATIDYIEITDSLTGFRKKMKPNLSGTYETSKDKEYLKVVIENDSLHLMYSTPYAEWKETVLNANETELLVVNTNKDMYLYKRYEPLDLEEEVPSN